MKRSYTFPLIVVALVAYLGAIIACGKKPADNANSASPVSPSPPQADAIKGILGLEVVGKEVVGAAEFIRPEALLAYVAEGDKSIYVAAGRDEEVAAGLGAVVEGSMWTLKEEGGEDRRERRELKPQDYYPRIMIVRWTYLKGYKCEEKPAGSWLNIVKEGNRFVRSYRTTEPGWWCITQPGERCKIIMKEVEGEFWTRPEGDGERKIEKRKLSACSP